MRCECERPGPTALRVFGSQKIVRVARICEACFQGSVPADLCAVTDLTIRDILFQMRQLHRHQEETL